MFIGALSPKVLLAFKILNLNAAKETLKIPKVARTIPPRQKRDIRNNILPKVLPGIFHSLINQPKDSIEEGAQLTYLTDKSEEESQLANTKFLCHVDTETGETFDYFEINSETGEHKLVTELELAEKVLIENHDGSILSTDLKMALERIFSELILDHAKRLGIEI